MVWRGGMVWRVRTVGKVRTADLRVPTFQTLPTIPTSVDRAGAGTARIAAVAARRLLTDRSFGGRMRPRLGGRAGLRGEDGEHLLKIGALARRTGWLVRRAREVLEPVSAAAAFVFEKRHGVF